MFRMAKLKMFLRNRNIIFLLAMAVGLLLPQAARGVSPVMTMIVGKVPVKAIRKLFL